MTEAITSGSVITYMCTLMIGHSLIHIVAVGTCTAELSRVEKSFCHSISTIYSHIYICIGRRWNETAGWWQSRELLHLLWRDGFVWVEKSFCHNTYTSVQARDGNRCQRQALIVAGWIRVEKSFYHNTSTIDWHIHMYRQGLESDGSHGDSVHLSVLTRGLTP